MEGEPSACLDSDVLATAEGGSANGGDTGAPPPPAKRSRVAHEDGGLSLHSSAATHASSHSSSAWSHSAELEAGGGRLATATRPLPARTSVAAAESGGAVASLATPPGTRPPMLPAVIRPQLLADVSQMLAWFRLVHVAGVPQSVFHACSLATTQLEMCSASLSEVDDGAWEASLREVDALAEPVRGAVAELMAMYEGDEREARGAGGSDAQAATAVLLEARQSVEGVSRVLLHAIGRAKLALKRLPSAVEMPSARQ